MSVCAETELDIFDSSEDSFIDNTDDSSEKNINKSRRENIIGELLLTEITYVNFLNIIQFDFYLPLLEASTSSSTLILSREEIDIIFQNISEILSINKILVKNIKQRIVETDFSYETSKFTDIFVNLFDNPKTPVQEEYQKYINNYNQSLACLIEVQKNNNKFKKFSSNILSKYQNFANIQSYLISPIQRLPRYVLMLNDLKKHTPDNHDDYLCVNQAVEKILNITEQINSGKRFYEDMLRKEVLFKRFSQSGQQLLENNIHPQDLIIEEGLLLQETKSKHYSHRHIIVTTNNIIVAQKRKSGSNNDLKLCHCLSILSCNVNFNDDDSIIQLISLDRINTPPFITKSIYNFKIIDNNEDNDWDFWENTLKKSIQQTMNAAALMNRATETKSHLQLVLLRKNDWDILLKDSKTLTIKAGKSLISKDTSIDCLYKIQNGFIDILKDIEGTSKVISSLSDNDFIGDTNFLRSIKTGRSYSLSGNYVAQIDTTIQKIPYNSIISGINEDSEIGWRFYFLISALIGEKLIRINAILSKTISMDDAAKSTPKRRSSIAVSTSSKKRLSANKKRSITNKETNETTKKELTKKYSSIEKHLKETIHSNYSCKFKTDIKTGSVSGVLLFSVNYICFYRKVFGRKTQLIIPGIAITTITNTDNDDKSLILNYLPEDSKDENTIIISLRNTSDVKQVKILLEKYSESKTDSSNIWAKSLSTNSISFHTKEMDIFEKETSYEKHEIIVEAGILSDCVYQLTSGRCRVEIENSSGQRQVVGQIRRGETFGELSFLLGIVTGAYVIADSSSTSVVQCSWENLSTLTSNNTDSALQFYKYLSQVLSKRFLTAENKVINPQLKVSKTKSSKMPKRRTKTKS